MNIRNKVKQLVRRLAEVRYIGRAVTIAVAVWRAPQTRMALDETRMALDETRMALDETKVMLDDAKRKFRAISEGYGAAISGIENAVRRHEISFGTLKSTIESRYDEKISNIELDNASLRSDIELVGNLQASIKNEFKEKILYQEVDNKNIRSRVEFIRKEILFELRKQLRVDKLYKMELSKLTESRIVNFEKINNAGLKKLNLGCGHLTKGEFINVDSRDLPGVDLISDVTSLPFEMQSIDGIYAAHLIEHFSERALKDTILPHWFDILKIGGELVLIAPDTKAMIEGYVKGIFDFDELREVIFGGQEYEGDFHFTMLTPEITVKLLRECGFSSAKVVDSARRNGACFEFEVHAQK